MSKVTKLTKPKTSGPVFDFKNKTALNAEIVLYGPIGEDFFGEGISGKAFQKELKALGNPRNIDLRIDSPGGSVFDARVIYTQLVEHRANVTVYVDGVAASAASYIAMAGDTIKIAEGGFFMIHQARGISRGTADQFERDAALLRQVDNTIAETYVARTGVKKADIEAWMAEEKWMDGNEAVKLGFANELLENKKVAAFAFDYSKLFGSAPRELRPSKLKARRALASLNI